MADQDEDFSSLPLPDRFTHKNWKVRKEGYEAAAKEFSLAASESDPVVRQFISDASIWKGVVGDSNVAAQQEGLGALCAFLDIAGQQGCTRTRNIAIATIAEKGLPSTRPAAKQKALEALMLYVETDKPDPVIEELLPVLGNKQPKVIAATLDALTQIYHAYGCKTIEPKPVLKLLPKVYGHADKNVRAKAQELTVELYRWLKEAMKPLFWNELKPVQQQDLDKLFEKVKDEPPPKQERLLRSQQAAKEAAVAAPGGDDDYEEEDEAAIDLEPEYEAVDVLSKIPKDFSEKLASSKWKDRKETLDEVHKALNHPRIAEGPFDELVRGFAKSMKDANIAVVITAANCVELLAKGLKKSFAKYRKDVMNAMMERLKEKKQTVTDAIGAALDASFASTSFQECLEEILEFLKHKNPQVKLESSRFLIRCLKNTREAPTPEQAKAIAEASTKLLTESQEVQRSVGAETLGTLWKIMGDRIMNAHLDGLDEIRKTKIKEFFDAAEVKSKYKPKAAPAPKPAAAAAPTKKPMGKRPAPGGMKKPAPAAKAPPLAEEPVAPLESKPTSRPGVSKLGAKPGGAAPSRLGGLKKPGSGLAAPSPRRPVASPPPEEEAPPPQPKFGAGRGLAGRPLGKPAPEPAAAPTPQAPTGLSLVERAELDELRAEVERVRRQNEDLRSERTKLTSQIHELQNQNAQLIEDHTRDVLSIKAKETQLVRARSDFEASEQTVQNQRREVDRLKRELSRQVRASSPPATDVAEQIYADSASINTNGAQFGDSGYGSRGMHARRERSFASGPTSPGGDGKENFDSLSRPGSNLSGKLSPRADASGKSSLSSRGGGRMSPAENGTTARATSQASSGAESWKRAAEVTQNLKQRIEMMKAKQGIGRQQQ
ncbi:ARM repeat-containing protein [Decorospora gaudefroyi]|uniref:ARM repeat-containing protein n=1 Tax=Decorospora gaudefroyi TaxID=184978 RepID=A0A6A5KJW1_9PLEO|nr:ARM repeat-containing protein [Decorospora gaudefroyi]